MTMSASEIANAAFKEIWQAYCGRKKGSGGLDLPCFALDRTFVSPKTRVWNPKFLQIANVIDCDAMSQEFQDVSSRAIRHSKIGISWSDHEHFLLRVMRTELHLDPRHGVLADSVKVSVKAVYIGSKPWPAENQLAATGRNPSPNRFTQAYIRSVCAMTSLWPAGCLDTPGDFLLPCPNGCGWSSAMNAKLESTS